MVTTEKILQTMNSWQSGEVIAVRRKKCSGASSHPKLHVVYPQLSTGEAGEQGADVSSHAIQPHQPTDPAGQTGDVDAGQLQVPEPHVLHLGEVAGGGQGGG